MDRSTLALPADQNRLITAVAAANPHTIVVLNTSSAVTMPWLSKVAGVIEVWYRGQTAGTAIAHVLFGDVNPSGKLPVTFPRSDRRVRLTRPAKRCSTPATAATSTTARACSSATAGTTPRGSARCSRSVSACPTPRSSSDLSVQVTGKQAWTVTAQVTNTGSLAGAEVAQLYVGFPSSTSEPPKQLKGFTRITLQPGQTRTVTFTLNADSVAIWDTAANGWTVQPGEYRVLVGNSSRDLPLHGSLTVR